MVVERVPVGIAALAQQAEAAEAAVQEQMDNKVAVAPVVFVIQLDMEAQHLELLQVARLQDRPFILVVAVVAAWEQILQMVVLHF
jgi:hypothetical protein